MPFAGYDDWNAGQTYERDSVVYYKSYLYVAMTECDAGDNPLTSTFTQVFSDGDFGFGRTWPTSEDPYPENSFSKTMRKWTIFDLPFGYYYSKLCGLYGTPLSRVNNYSNVGEEVMVLNIYRLGGPYDAPDLPKMGYNWSNYGIPHGLNSEWPEPDFVLGRGGDNEQSIPSELVYHISFVPLDPQSPSEIMPEQYGDDNVSGFMFQSHLYQENTSTFFIKRSQYGGDMNAVRGLIMYYATFSRAHNYKGSPEGTLTRNSPAFADNYEASITDLPITDPPTSWYLTGISPDHPD